MIIPNSWRVLSGKMSEVYLLGLLIICLITGCRTGKQGNQADERPNIIIVMADDMGFSDLGSYGGEIKTPNIDRLAYNGLRFNSFYNTARCVPSRGAMLTGLYPHQAGVGKMTRDEGRPGYRGTLSSQSITIAEVLKKQGYQTGMTGKWHLSPTEPLDEEEQLEWLSHQTEKNRFSELKTYPIARGFDKFYGTIWGVVDYFDPFSLVNGKEPVEEVPEDFYYTDAIGDTAVAYVEEFSKDAAPFFLYVAHTAPHWPLQAPKEEIKKYDDVYTKGWREIRKKRYKKLLEKGILQGDVVELSKFMFPKKIWEDNPNKEWDARAMAVHAAMIDRLDQSVGNLIDKLEEIGELENTVIFFLSDNGASSERPSRYGPGFDRAGSTREGEKILFPVEKDVLPGSQTVHSGIGPLWANVSNTPFKYWKGRVYEGGISSPFIVHWPKGSLEEGSVRSEAAHIIDLMATSLDLADAEYPETFKGLSIKPMAGKSMMPIIRGESDQNTHEVYFWEHMGSAAIREKDWKLVRLNPGAPWELYNLTKDRTETKNLAPEYLEKVQELKEKWNQMAHELQVLPAPNKPKAK